MNYLLDTNAAIALIKGEPPEVRKRFKRALADKSSVFLSVIALHELWYGVALSNRPEDNARDVRSLLTVGIGVLSFDEEDAEAAGEIRAKLKLSGKPIGPFDLLIAAQARRLHATIVTANTREFAQVEGLKWQNWAGSR